MKVDPVVGPSTLRKILDALANALTFKDNLRAKLIGPVVTPGTIDTEFTVVHKLGAIPTNYIWNLNQAGTVYDSRRSSWTSTEMFLKCNASAATLYLIVT